MLDVRDILVGGNSSLEGLLRCIVNTPISSTLAEKRSIRKDFHEAFLKALIVNPANYFAAAPGVAEGLRGGKHGVAF